MARNTGLKILIRFILLGMLFMAFGCDTGVETSPNPGTLRVNLVADPADTTIIIVTDTLHVTDSDRFPITVFQGKVYRDSAYALLYPTVLDNSQRQVEYNLIRRENNEYQKFTIFESYVPPQTYNKIQFGIDSQYLKIKNFDEITVETPANYFMEVSGNFEISENKVTEVNIKLSPFKSVERYKDTYIFNPSLELVDVTYY